MTPNDVIKYLRDILNIDLNNSLVMEDMIEDLKSIHDLNTFRVFIKENFNKDRYKYLNGYQKFVSLANDFKKQNKPKLSSEQEKKVNNYSDELFKKTVDVFDYINWEVQIGCDLYDKKISLKLFNVFGNEPKDLQVLERIGKRPQLLNLVNNHKESLRNKIYEVVHNLTVEKTYPQLQNKSKDALLIERISNG